MSGPRRVRQLLSNAMFRPGQRWWSRAGDPLYTGSIRGRFEVEVQSSEAALAKGGLQAFDQASQQARRICDTDQARPRHLRGRNERKSQWAPCRQAEAESRGGARRKSRGARQAQPELRDDPRPRSTASSAPALVSERRGAPPVAETTPSRYYPATRFRSMPTSRNRSLNSINSGRPRSRAANSDRPSRPDAARVRLVLDDGAVLPRRPAKLLFSDARVDAHTGAG